MNGNALRRDIRGAQPQAGGVPPGLSIPAAPVAVVP